jgi:hypothetical protein
MMADGAEPPPLLSRHNYRLSTISQPSFRGDPDVHAWVNVKATA